MDSLKLGIDCDGVMYDFIESFFGYLDEIDYWLERGLPAPTDRHFYKWDDYERFGFTGEQFMDLCIQGCNAEYIFRKGEPIPGSVETLTRLKDQGHTIHIITHRTFGDKPVHNTIDWLSEYGIEYDTITFAENKTIVGVDLLVDDRVKNYQDSWAQHIPCVLMTNSSNLGYSATFRVDDWEDYEETVNILAENGFSKMNNILFNNIP